MPLALAGAVLVALIGAAVVLAGLWLRGRGRLRGLGRELREHIDPYLRRKAAEAGLAVSRQPFSVRTPPEEILAYASGLADRLLALERGDVPPVAAEDDLGRAATERLPGDPERPARAVRTTTPEVPFKRSGG